MATMMDSAPGSVGPSRHAPHTSLPASPTLTNPDMILPDYDRSPSPLDDPMQSPLLMWRGAHASQAQGIANGVYDTHAQQLQGFSGGVAPTTPIIYGNGTMLSDIGEVTEAESTPGRPSPPRQRYGAVEDVSPGPKGAVDSEGDAALRSSPTIGKSGASGGVKKRAKATQRERRSSTDSNSTITGDDRGPAPVFADFDDTVSVGDSVFQGDDEESLASSYVDDASLIDGPSLLAPGLSRDSGQKYTTAQLSRRAEQILANAKKRLTHMEDNLSRARTSLLVASPYSGSDGSTPSPPIARASTALMMSTNGLATSPGSGHRRMSSENSLRIGIPIKVYPQRSSSVLGVTTAPRHHSLIVSKSADQLNGQFNRQRASYIMRDGSLEPLGEDDVSQSSHRAESTVIHRYSTITSPTFGVSSDRGLSRSASTSQMRDIKDQVKDLKGKISSLREQARADSLKRRSLQTLRTPSPFTHAQINQWYVNTGGEPDTRSLGSGGENTPWNGEMNGEDSPRNDDLDTPVQDDFGLIPPIAIPVISEDATENTSDQLDDDRDLGPYEAEEEGVDDDDDMLTENGDVEGEDVRSEYEEAVDDGYDVVSESGDSIYHESVQHQVSHEDREDAFDYEHFFLHSAMGTLGQRTGRRGSDASFSSEESVETTRGPTAEETEEADGRPKDSPALTRRGSETSISTIETFATAEEGRSSRHESVDHASTVEDDEDGEDEDQFEQEAFPALYTTLDAVERPDTPPTAKRATFAGVGSPPFTPSQTEQRNSRPELLYSAMRRPMSSTAATRRHAPSVSSVASSTGTTRSFPLVNRSSKSGSSGIPTPDGGSGSLDSGARPLSSPGVHNSDATDNGQKPSTSTSTSISLHSSGSATSLIEESGTTAVMETLPRDDQFLVERLVASLGRCVLGLTENSRASTEARMYRRRIDAARRILEGFEQV